MENQGVNSFARNINIVINGNVHLHAVFPGETVPLSFSSDELGEIVKQKPEITFNTDRTYKNGKKAPDGIELRFGTARPTEETRTILKEHGFQFSEKQTIWYAIDNEKSREWIGKFEQEGVDVDTTQYVKHNFWAKVKGQGEFNNLRERTEFMVAGDPPAFYYNKGHLQKSNPDLFNLFLSGKFFFKKFYNKPVEEEESGEPGSEENGAIIAEKLQALAEGMQELIDSKIHSATSQQRRTAKRVRVAAGMREEGYKLQDIQRVLYALAEGHRSGSIKDGNYHYLGKIRTKHQVELLNRHAKIDSNDWKSINQLYDNNIEILQKAGLDSPDSLRIANEQIKNIVDLYSPASSQNAERERLIKEMEDRIWRMNIPGFFPTPAELIARMLQLAELKQSDAILEPSAGKGDILDAITKHFGDVIPDLDAVEVNPTLQQFLELKGYNIIGNDFLQVEDSIYDKIIMNPPFENGQDVDHVTHALELLKHGGRVVAIVSEGPFFRPFKKDVAFRKLLQEKNAYISEPIKDAFKNTFNTASITVRIVAINEDGSPVNISGAGIDSATPSNSDISDQGNEDLKLLELEAEAELELLKMRVELERKRKQRPIDGVAKIDRDKLHLFRQKAWAMQDKVEILDFN